MKVGDILEHFLSRADWVDRSSTVDRVIIGDAEMDADRCVVTWMPSLGALREAVRRKVRLVVCHEPTFYNHRDDRPETHPPEEQIVQGSPNARGPRREVLRRGPLPRVWGPLQKQQFIQRHGLTIVRLHDTWDRWPKVGIPWAWAKFLGFGEAPAVVGGGGYQHRYDIAATTVRELSRRIARRCAAVGEPMVQVTGDDSQRVRRIGIGTGCGCDLNEYRRMGCEASIVCDDGSCYWAGIQMAQDAGHAVIRVNHGTSEEPGMVTLTQYINDNLPLKAAHLPHGSTFHLVGSSARRTGAVSAGDVAAGTAVRRSRKGKR